MKPNPEVHPSLLKRKIIHVDMDAFYASVEVRDNPALADKPLVIGGSPQSRAVVCTASYEARKFGIRSAMSCSRAYRLCPQAIFLPPNFSAYTAASEKIRAIFARYTDLIEPLSLDEAYLDVTLNQSGLFATQIAKAIQAAVRDELHLSCSVGVGPNKLIAKIASDLRKPGGITVVVPERVLEFMENLDVRKIFGVGPATEKRLHEIGISKCRDLWDVPIKKLEAQLGSFAHWIADAARGIDEREVETSWERKSLGREETFAADILDMPLLKQALMNLSKDVAESLAEEEFVGRTIVLKVKYADFQQITRSHSLPSATASSEEIFTCAQKLLSEKTEAGKRKIRLVGVSVSNLSSVHEDAFPSPT
jgi:DNA polymerase-4